MQYERRSNKRQRVSFSIELCQPGRKTLLHRVHNLTPGGMLLANNAQLFETGASIEIQLRHEKRIWTIPAMVTHCNSDCIGVMFKRRQAELFRSLTQPNLPSTGGGKQRFRAEQRHD